MKNLAWKRNHLRPGKIIIFGFLAVILTGTILLMLPIATRSRESAGFLDALFTATSATCVTGLVVQDTVSYWSLFGQVVILALIQIGGLGVVTMAVSIVLVSGKRIGLVQRNMMQEAIDAPQIRGIVRLTRFILILTFSIESIGAVIMMPTFIRDYGIARGIWYGIFHSISAFCNAGFDLLGKNQPFSSMIRYASDPVISVTIMALIIAGGLGFLTWNDILVKRYRFRMYRMQSKVILAVTTVLIFVPAVYFYLVEFKDGAVGNRLLHAFFQSVTPRTAGFNIADLTLLSETGLMVIILLMLIGGSPASTAGGMKTTTLAVLFSSAFAVFRRKKDATFFRRRISQTAIQNAGAVFLLYLTLPVSGAMVISTIENLPFITSLFETASAIGTVGLSLGITPGLSTVSCLILIFLMYVGRVGGLTLIFAAVSERPDSSGRLPEEKITVG